VSERDRTDNYCGHVPCHAFVHKDAHEKLVIVGYDSHKVYLKYLLYCFTEIDIRLGMANKTIRTRNIDRMCYLHPPSFIQIGFGSLVKQSEFGIVHIYFGTSNTPEI